MRNVGSLLAALLLAIGLSPSPAHAAGPWIDVVPDEILVKVQKHASAAVHAEVTRDADAEANEHVAHVDGGEIRKLRIRGTVGQALKNLSGNSWVEYVEPNYMLYADTIPNDTRFGELWGMRNTGQTVNGVAGTAGADIKAEPAWTMTTGTNTVGGGVVDTGIDYN